MSPKYVGLGIVFGMFGQSQTDVLEKMDRPEQLIFQIGISSGEVLIFDN